MFISSQALRPRLCAFCSEPSLWRERGLFSMHHLILFFFSGAVVLYFLLCRLKKKKSNHTGVLFSAHCVWVLQLGHLVTAWSGIEREDNSWSAFKIKQIWSVLLPPPLCDCLNRSVYNRQLGWCASIKEQRSPDKQSAKELLSLRRKRAKWIPHGRNTKSILIADVDLIPVLQGKPLSGVRGSIRSIFCCLIGLISVEVLLNWSVSRASALRLAFLTAGSPLWTGWGGLGFILKLDGLVEAAATSSAVWLSWILCWLVRSPDKSWPAALPRTVLGQTNISAWMMHGASMGLKK